MIYHQVVALLLVLQLALSSRMLAMSRESAGAQVALEGSISQRIAQSALGRGQSPQVPPSSIFPIHTPQGATLLPCHHL